MKDTLPNLKLELEKYKIMLYTCKQTDYLLQQFIQKEINKITHRIETIKKSKRR